MMKDKLPHSLFPFLSSVITRFVRFPRSIGTCQANITEGGWLLSNSTGGLRREQMFPWPQIHMYRSLMFKSGVEERLGGRLQCWQRFIVVWQKKREKRRKTRWGRGWSKGRGQLRCLWYFSPKIIRGRLVVYQMERVTEGPVNIFFFFFSGNGRDVVSHMWLGRTTATAWVRVAEHYGILIAFIEGRRGTEELGNDCKLWEPIRLWSNVSFMCK